MIKVILFDADGVLMNGKKFADHLLNDLHLTPEMTTPFFKGPFKECLIRKADLKEAISPYLPQWGWDKSVDEFLIYWFGSEHHVDEPLIAYIRNLREKGIKCYVATNQEKYRVRYIQDYMKLKPEFDGFFASNEIEACKPDETFFNHIISRLAINPGEALFWDDAEGNVAAAKRLGMNAEFYRDFEDFKLKLKDYIVE